MEEFYEWISNSSLTARDSIVLKSDGASLIIILSFHYAGNNRWCLK